MIAIEIVGTLRPDGTLVLDEKPALAPGRVRVALRPLGEGAGERLPDAPWLDEAIAAPFDLPHEQAIAAIRPRAISERLPELLTGLTDHDQ